MVFLLTTKLVETRNKAKGIKTSHTTFAIPQEPFLSSEITAVRLVRFK